MDKYRTCRREGEESFTGGEGYSEDWSTILLGAVRVKVEHERLSPVF